MQYFDTMEGAISFLIENDFTIKFDYKDDYLCHPNGQIIPIEDIGIEKIFSIAQNIDIDFTGFIYGIITPQKEKGYCIRKTSNFNV